MERFGVGRARTARIVVVAHLAAAVVHGAAHGVRGVLPDQALDLGIIVGAVYVGPLAAFALLSTRRGPASVLMLISMAAAFLYGAANHFILPGLDNAGSSAAGAVGVVFGTSALLMLVLEVEGAALGAMMAKDAWATRDMEVPQ